MNKKILAYRRENNDLGIRNYVLILSSVVCANQAVNLIGDEFNADNIIKLTHQHGCTQGGNDKSQTLRTLQGIALNPNVAAVLVVGLGCETIKAEMIAKPLLKAGKLFKAIEIQNLGGLEKTIKAGRKIIEDFINSVSKLKREEMNISDLTVGLECGGSDAFSGITANPAVGIASDILVKSGAKVILSEMPELIGAEHVLGKRAANSKVKDKLFNFIEKFENKAIESGIDIREANPTPGNRAGGISTLEEKSLGCIYKGGSSSLNEVVDYGEMPKKKGLVVMNTPGNDIESLSGMAAGGAQLMIFTTGRGTPAGCIVAPTIKISTNSKLARKMKDIIDLNSGVMIDQGKTKEEFGEIIFEEIIDVAEGKLTKSEIWKQYDFAINRIGPSY